MLFRSEEVKGDDVNADTVYKEVKKVKWENYMSLDKTFAIDSVIYSEDFNHSKFVAYRTKDAIVDYFMEKDEALSSIPVIGPSGEGAQLEGSKDFAKAFMMRHHIPTARYKSISTENLEEGYAFLESLSAPYVWKADK